MPLEDLPSPLNTTALFLRDVVGLEVRGYRVATGFLPGVRIEKGVLQVSPAASAGDLLHEAGHMAVLPPRVRVRASDDVDRATHYACEIAIRFIHNPDHPFHRALIQADDTSAIAWAWAVGMRIGLSPEEIIEDEKYGARLGWLALDDGMVADHESAEPLRQGLASGHDLGVHGLHHAGLCRLPRHSDGFPTLIKWLQDADAPEIPRDVL